MRITGGKYSGRTVYCPPGIIRPTMDRMRESVFAILGDLEGCSFLDLFSGSGLVALEAASRGASRIVAVEKDPAKRAVIARNLALAQGTVELHIAPVERYLKRAKPVWSYLFLDPPFAYRYKEELLRVIAMRKLLGTVGVALIHHPAPEKLPEQVVVSGAGETGDSTSTRTLERFDRRLYGGSAVDFYRPADG